MLHRQIADVERNSAPLAAPDVPTSSTRSEHITHRRNADGSPPWRAHIGTSLRAVIDLGGPQ